MRLERLELQKGMAGGDQGGGLSHEETLSLLEGLVSRREAALKEDFRQDTTARIQVGAEQRAHRGGPYTPTNSTLSSEDTGVWSSPQCPPTWVCAVKIEGGSRAEGIALRGEHLPCM